MARAALPAIVLRLKENVLRSATRAGNAIRPAMSYEVFATVVSIREVKNCFLKGLGFFNFHASILPGKT
jgi:hypothetical protein